MSPKKPLVPQTAWGRLVEAAPEEGVQPLKNAKRIETRLIDADPRQPRKAFDEEAMAELEAICARLSAERMTVDERHMLELEHKASMRLVHTGAEEKYSAHNTEFHTRLYRGAHNDHIFEMVIQTRARLAPFRRAQFRLPGRLAKSYEEHGRIVTAIMRADGAAAAQAAYSHVEIVSDASAVFATAGE